MGASAWDYYVPYQSDLNAALLRLQAEVLASGDYAWGGDADERPASMAELWADEDVQTGGTHSILDVERVLGPGERADFGSVVPVTADEARRCAGTEVLTREHAPLINGLAAQRWIGRCAVLHDAEGRPAEIYFFGFSGD